MTDFAKVLNDHSVSKVNIPFTSDSDFWEMARWLSETRDHVAGAEEWRHIAGTFVIRTGVPRAHIPQLIHVWHVFGHRQQDVAHLHPSVIRRLAYPGYDDIREEALRLSHVEKLSVNKIKDMNRGTSSGPPQRVTPQPSNPIVAVQENDPLSVFRSVSKGLTQLSREGHHDLIEALALKIEKLSKPT